MLIHINGIPYTVTEVKPGEVGLNQKQHIFYGITWKRLSRELQEPPSFLEIDHKFYEKTETYTKYPGYDPNANFDVHWDGLWYRFKLLSLEEGLLKKGFYKIQINSTYGLQIPEIKKQ